MGAPRQEIQRITERLYDAGTRLYPVSAPAENRLTGSVVAFLLRPAETGLELVLTRRSARVRQPGDLCCPGGGAEPLLDRITAGLLRFPGSPLARWPLRSRWRQDNGTGNHALAALLATALRECLEEIRMMPFGVHFLGMLPPQKLAIFKRAIYPAVFWVPRHKRFRPNWEVDAMVPISIAGLMENHRYICYRLRFDNGAGIPEARDFHGFRYADNDDIATVLWGATFRMTMDYLRLVHGFAPPALESLPVVHRRLGPSYLAGNGSPR
jgi:8-oxo-dGTP pyrophosphatase MutT (NUDIX family)